MSSAIDSENEVVRLCAQGIESEMRGERTAALKLYMHAWEIKKTDYEACISAHYIARLQANYEDILKWNKLSLEYAIKVNDESVYIFLPSLYLNIGKAYEDLKIIKKAKLFYEKAHKSLYFLPKNNYADIVETAIADGLQRLLKI